MKANCVTDADDVAKQNVVVWVKFNFGRIAFVSECVHGVTPALFRKSLAFRTWYRLASLPG